MTDRNLPGFYPSVESQLTETGQLSDQTTHDWERNPRCPTDKGDSDNCTSLAQHT